MAITLIEDIETICREIKLDKNLITNVYNFGSRVHGCATSSSDYDLLIIGRFEQDPLEFKTADEKYFHQYDLRTCNIGEKKYEVILYSNDNFELLLARHFLLAVESLFNPPEFIPINKIDYQALFLEQYYDPQLIDLALKAESQYSFYCVRRYQKGLGEFDAKWVQKKLFNIVRYNDTTLELITLGTISDLSRTNPIRFKMTEMQARSATFDEIYDYLTDILKMYQKRLTNVLSS